MGHTIKTLATSRCQYSCVFDRRFVVELCERVHVHYRNLRVQLSLSDFLEVCHGMIRAYERWQKLGRPEPGQGVHVELCRRQVAQDVVNDGMQVNLNENLYARNAGRIYAEGAELADPTYIHLKLRDLRLELTVEEFRALAKVIGEAEEQLEESCQDLKVLD